MRRTGIEHAADASSRFGALVRRASTSHEEVIVSICVRAAGFFGQPFPLSTVAVDKHVHRI
jgi:hypothetical protein